MSNLSGVTELDRAKAQEARKANREAGIAHANTNLKLDWADEQHWKGLCSELGIRRFQWYEPANVKNMRKAIKKVGKDSVWFTDTFGYSKYEEHFKANPKMTANAFLGFCTEQVFEDTL